MRVLVACEESQEVCKAFRNLGHEAYSCDIQECSGGHPEWHIKGDCLPFLNGYKTPVDMFITQDGKSHYVPKEWDLIIAHPPCTYLTSCGASNLFNRDGSVKDKDRYLKGVEAKQFFMAFYNANCHRIAIENPTPIGIFGLPKYSQIIEPYMFGDHWRKRTVLWLKNLPLLMGTDVVVPEGLWVNTRKRKSNGIYSLTGVNSAKERSKTFPGIARAMANQWGSLEVKNG